MTSASVAVEQVTLEIYPVPSITQKHGPIESPNQSSIETSPISKHYS